jgi:hypothetical protein
LPNTRHVFLGVNHLSDFYEWLQQKREAKVSFLPWARTMLSDETIMGMKWDDFIGPTEPERSLTPSKPSSRPFQRRETQQNQGYTALKLFKEKRKARPLEIWPLLLRKVFHSSQQTMTGQ